MAVIPFCCWYIMKLRIAPIAGVYLLMLQAASADTRVFIIANPPSHGGVDRCLAGGEACGAEAALAYCQSREFSRAEEYRRVDPDEVTGAVPKAPANCGGNCNEYVAIVCRR
jgi:hypothetical protein